MFFTEMCPSGGTKYVSFELFLSTLREPGEGRGGAPGTVPLQNPEVTEGMFEKCHKNSLCRKLSGIFVVLNLEDFAGDFPGGFFWALFPTKMRRKNPATKSAKKSGGSKIKIREKSVLPKSDPKKCR